MFKRILFLLSFIVLMINSLFAQDNIHYFAEEGTIWNIGAFSSICNIPHTMIFHKMQGDTVINSINYHIIWQLPCEMQMQYDTTVAYFTRVDQNKKQWLRTPNGIEYKIFDYNLELYDSFNGYAYWNGDNFIGVEAVVCTVQYKDFLGVTRKVWGLGDTHNSQPVVWWIEGIGPSSSILHANMFLTDVYGGFDEVLCAYADTTHIYDNPDYHACEIYDSRHYDRFELFAPSKLEFNVVEYWESNIYNSNNLLVAGNTSQDCSYYSYYHIASIDKEDGFNIFPSEYVLFKVWSDSLLYVAPKGHESHLAFDYKAELGDTLHVAAYNYYLDTFVSVTAEIFEIDSLFTDDGVQRKYWVLSNENGSTKYVEGLGNDEGLTAINWHLTGLDSTRYAITCAWEMWISGDDHTLIYDNPDFDSCTYVVDIIEDSIENDTSASASDVILGSYPNPFENKFKLIIPEDRYKLKIYNSFGAIILELISDEPECEIDLSGFSRGIYYLRIETDKGVMPKTVVKI